MNKLYTALSGILAIPILLLLIWNIAVPTDLIEEHIEYAMERSDNNMSIAVSGLNKGIFFALNADNLDLEMDNQPAIRISDFSGAFTPRYLTDKKPAFNIKGQIGTGNVTGVLKLPVEGNILIDRAELSAIPYLSRFGIEVGGSLSSEITIIDNNSVSITFEIPDIDIASSALAAVPFLNTFHKMQGSLSISGNTIKLDSVSLEGEKGYARVKGNIINGVMNLKLEVMPLAGTLGTLESMIIGKYIISPGYYVIPITGPLN